MREIGRTDNDLLDRLAADPRLGVTRAELDAALADPVELSGMAGRQVAALVSQIETIAEAHPEAALYRPGPVLEELQNLTLGSRSCRSAEREMTS